MDRIQFSRLSIEEAERCIVEIWMCLEEYQFSSPVISFDSEEESSISFSIIVDDPVAASTLLTRVANASGANDAFGGLSAEHRPAADARLTLADEGAAPLGLIFAFSAPA